MEPVFLLLALQLAASAAGFAWLWRRQRRLSDEVARLRRACQELEARLAVPSRRSRRTQGAVLSVEDYAASPDQEPPLARAARAWSLPADGRALSTPTMTPATGRGLALALIAMAPAAGLLFGVGESMLTAAGLAIAAAMMLIALRPTWRAAAWAAVLTAAAWALVGFLRGAAHADPVSYSVCLALAAAAGLAYAQQRRATPGAAMALVMGAAALVLAGQSSMIGPAGAAFGAIMAAAAIVGASTLRLEGMHLAAFGAALIGLFVLSGQDGAAIWFTPAAAWVGALFFSIAAIRTPQLGARGAALAGTGALAPFAAIAALYAAQHGLADRYAAAGAFAALAALLAGLIAVAANRQDGGAAGLRLALWILTLGAFASGAAALVLAAPGPLAAPGFATLGFGLLWLNLRVPDAAWRAFACIAGGLSALFALANAEILLAEAHAWPAQALIAAGFVAPALIAAAAAAAGARAGAHATAGFFEALVIVLAVASVNLAVRLLFSGGAPMLQPIGLAEAGTHSAVWLSAALAIGSRPRRHERGVRTAAIHVLSLMALAAAVAASVQWIAAYWGAQAPVTPPSPRQTLGFLLPGLLFWAHWVFWRARGADLQTRVSLGAGALLMAAFVTVEAARTDVPDWLGALVGALSFALAIGVNFAPGVTSADARGLNFEEDFHRHGRGQKRSQPR